MALLKDAPKKTGDYSEPGIHPQDEKDASGLKKKFDRGDHDENKTDIIQDKTKGANKNAEIPQEYAEPGIHNADELDASGHKKKFDRAAPEENPSALHHADKQKTDKQIQGKFLHEEVSKPNYVADEHNRHKEAVKEGFKGLSEKEFLENLVSKASAGGWNSPIVDEIKHRIESLNDSK